MEIIRGLHNLRPRHHGCVATIGNFDGVHLGHQAVLGQLAEKADELNLPMTVIVFEPQPQEFFRPDQAPPRLSRFREKVQALRRYAVDRVMCLRFDDRLASMSADPFIDDLLVRGLGVQYLVVGHDFRFGRGREGDFERLRVAGQAQGFQVASMRAFSVDGQRVSSTRVRQALAAGDLAAAEKLLGRPYRMIGRVAHGDGRGQTIGFPTANVHLYRQTSPVQGVFCVEVFGIAGEPWPGVANVGSRPTVDGRRCLLEIHLLDFEGDIYGHHLQVDFLHRLRPEERFDSLEALVSQIEADVRQARAFFNQRR